MKTHNLLCLLTIGCVYTSTALGVSLCDPKTGLEKEKCEQYVSKTISKDVTGCTASWDALGFCERLFSTSRTYTPKNTSEVKYEGADCSGYHGGCSYSGTIILKDGTVLSLFDPGESPTPL